MRSLPDGGALDKGAFDSGALTPGWAETFRAVPRSLFLPDLVWSFDMAAGVSTPVDRAEDPEAWERAAEADVPLVTQWDDGEHTGTDPGTMATSSASMPSVVAGMLRDLDCATVCGCSKSAPEPAGTPGSSPTGWAAPTWSASRSIRPWPSGHARPWTAPARAPR